MPIYKLPIIRLEGEIYTVDDRLCELRPLDQPSWPVRFEDEWEFVLTVLSGELVSGFLECDDVTQSWVEPRDTSRFGWLSRISSASIEDYEEPFIDF